MTDSVKKLIYPSTIIILYLLPEAIELIKEKLMHFLNKDNAILLCNTWGIKGITAKETALGGFANNVHFYLYDKSSLDK